MVRLVILTAPLKGQLFKVTDERAVIVGRGRDCDVSIDEKSVSRRHCELRPIDGHWYVRDLGSQNGTIVNGSRVVDTRILRYGDRLQMGRILLALTHVAEKETPSSDYVERLLRLAA